MTAFVSIFTILMLVLADQFIKLMVVLKLEPVGVHEVLTGFLQFRYVENTGAVFGSFSGNTAILSVVSAALLIAVIVYLAMGKVKSKFAFVCLIMIVAGGAGNLIDRIFRGFVIDYIEVLFVNFAVFNFADCLITVGAFSLVGYLLYDLIRERKSSAPPAAEDEAL
ncbi:MAG: signal peptidase II [Clostridiales bacterium]|nr:signal peptidase II [Clostridiales bacterium]